MNKNKVIEWSDKIAHVLLCVLMLDCCIFGAGRIVGIGSLSFRMIVLFALLVSALPLMLSKVKDLLKTPQIVMVLCFVGWLILATVVGIKNGNRTDLILSDLKGFMYLVLLPAAMCLLSSKKRIQTLMKVMTYGAFALSILVVVYLLLYLYYPAFLNQLITVGHELMFTRISGISSKIPRIFFHSELYMLCGCAFATYFQVKEDKFSVKYIVIVATCLMGLIMSYTRSIYLAMAVAAVATILSVVVRNTKEKKKNAVIHMGAAIAVFLVLLLLLSLIGQVNYLGYAFSRIAVTGENTTFKTTAETEEVTQTQAPTEEVTQTQVPTEEVREETISSEKEQQEFFNQQTILSDQIRQQTVNELWDNIKKSPLIGIGLGAEIPCRSDGYNEFFFLDLWSKCGIIGLIIYIMPAIYMAVSLFTKTCDEEGKRIKGVWLSVLLGFMVYSYFNPYMNASLGVLFYCCTMSVHRNTDMLYTSNTKNITN